MMSYFMVGRESRMNPRNQILVENWTSFRMKINVCDHLIFELLKHGIFLQEVLLLQEEYQLVLVLTANPQCVGKFVVKL